MGAEKITILGGGSPFTPSLIVAMLEHSEALEGSEVCLMDINPERLPVLVELGQRLARRENKNLSFTYTTNSREALKGATVVMPTYRIGGLEHMRYDIKVPTKYGIPGDETSGPGGTFMAQCTIPATLDYCKLIEDLCPDAWLVSFVNPANAVADAVFRESNVNFISICDCFAGLSMEFLPRVLDMPPFARRYCVSSDIKPRAIGVNHLTWLVDLKVNGEDGYPILKSKLKDYEGKRQHDREPSDFSLSILETYGYLNVCPRHVLPYWGFNRYLEERKDYVREEKVLGWSEERWNFVQELLSGASYDSRPKDEYCFMMYHARHVIGIIISIVEDEGREWGGIQFRNQGSIENLPYDAIVEGPALVDSRGISPIQMGKLPRQFLGLTQQIINWQELTVDAALEGDKGILLQAILASPYVNDIDAAKAIMDELLAAHQEYLPQYD